MSHHTAPPQASRTVDVSRLLALRSEGASLILGVFIVTNVVFTISTLQALTVTWPAYLATVIVSLAGVLLGRPHPDPFPLRDSLLVAAAVIVSTLLISWCLPAEGPLGRESWHLGSNTWLLWFLILRGRTALAWVTMAGMAAITAVWAGTTGRGAVAGLMMVDTQIGLLVVATLFVITLRRTAHRINELTERSVDSAAAAATAEAERQVRLQRAAEVAATSLPHLQRVAEGSALSDDERATMREVEARLRDSVRGRALATPAVLDAAARARARGVDVTLLDDRGAGLASGAAMSRVDDAVAAALDSASGAVTVRLLPAAREEAVTIVAVAEDAVSRIVLDEDGNATAA
ncbi:hypothetical protein [Demequina mangrovi]|uniref:Signal transduction histidine kinase n=1 Tax=Demequina mangrovi TaxID=1043493 RepID=A0A1H7A5X2_9MICO|nr:hypothetical protein [Demequina mangrovi]SEJ60991.1 hypothetical protein SAMN05421637_2383 [Demequina mangrovi]